MGEKERAQDKQGNLVFASKYSVPLFFLFKVIMGLKFLISFFFLEGTKPLTHNTGQYGQGSKKEEILFFFYLLFIYAPPLVGIFSDRVVQQPQKKKKKKEGVFFSFQKRICLLFFFFNGNTNDNGIPISLSTTFFFFFVFSAGLFSFYFLSYFLMISETLSSLL